MGRFTRHRRPPKEQIAHTWGKPNYFVNRVTLRSRQSASRAGADTQPSSVLTLELVIKALYRHLNPNSNPESTHNLLRLFNSLHKDVKSRLRSKWERVSGRSSIAQNLTLDAFLYRYGLLFESSRYLYEQGNSYSKNTKDFDIAIWLIAEELVNRKPDKTLLYNLVGVLSHE